MQLIKGLYLYQIQDYNEGLVWDRQGRSNSHQNVKEAD